MDMSESWPPTTGPDDAEQNGPAADAGDASANPIPLGPSTPSTPSYWREYPYAGAPQEPVTPPAGEVYQPRPFATGPGYPPSGSPYPGQGAPTGSPTPPAGSWPAPPYQGPGGPWGGVPGAPTPPYGGWPPPPGYAPPPPPSSPKGRRGLVAGLVALFAVVAVLAGAGLGHVVWSSPTTASATQGSGDTGGTTSPYGSGGELSPYGSGGGGSSAFGGSGSGSSSGGNSSTGAGAPSDVSAIAAKVDPDLVDINTNLSYEDEEAAGTGMVLTSNGVVLTNNHVIDGSTSISVTDIGNGKTYSARVIGYDRTGDVAVIKLVNASGLDTVSISSGTAAVGQAVVGVGNAGGSGGTPSAAGGSITAVGQSITASDDGGGNAEHLSGLIETNAGIEPGDSGGPLVNSSGQVLGMDTAASEDSGYEDTASQGYTIPIETALKLAKKIEDGDASSTVHIGATGFLGVSVSSGATSTGGEGGEGSGLGGLGGSTGTGTSTPTTPGADVEGTLSGSPAAKAGLVQGDVITAVNGSSITSSTDLSNDLERYHPGDSVQLQWTTTSGQTQTASITLENGPPA